MGLLIAPFREPSITSERAIPCVGIPEKKEKECQRTYAAVNGDQSRVSETGPTIQIETGVSGEYPGSSIFIPSRYRCRTSEWRAYSAWLPLAECLAFCIPWTYARLAAEPHPEAYLLE